MTAEDVKYSFDRVLEPGKEKKKSPQYGNIRAIKEVKIVDAETIHIITDKPFPLLLERLVYFAIVPKKHIEKVGDQAFGTTAAVGTGPWKLVEWKRDQHIRLEAFDQHWRGKPAVQVPRLPRRPRGGHPGGRDQDRRRRHHPQRRPPTSSPSSRTIRRRTCRSTPILRVHYVELDMRAAPFDKKPARQAANYAIDKQAIIQKMMAGLGQQVATVVQPLAFGFDPEVQPYPVRSQEGQGAPGPGRLSRTAWTSRCTARRPTYRPQFEAIAQMLTEVGLRTTPRMWDPGPAWNKFFQAEGKATNAAYGTWGNYSVFDADAVLHPLYHTEPGGWIGKHYTRVEGLDKLIDEGALDGGPAQAQADLRADPDR